MKTALVLLVATGCLSKPGFGGGGDDVPVAVVEPLLAVGDNHACAIDSQQQLWCWGNNDSGQVGTNDPTPVVTPVRVGIETGWTAVSAGREHTCGILAGQVRCWGAHGANQTDGALHPEDPVDLGGFVPTRVFAHQYGTCVLDAAGAMKCWGQPALASTAAADVDPGGRGLAFAQVAFNQDHACAVATDGTVYCWGSNAYQQLGVDGPDVVDPATAMPRAGTYLAVSVQASTTCAVTADHALECWGNVDTSLYAEQQPMTATSLGTTIDSGNAWGALSLSQSYGCGDAGGKVFCWGYSENGELGDGYGYHAILSAPALTGTTGVVTGDGFTCARDTSGTVSCWGQNRYGNLGNGEVARVQAPVALQVEPPLMANDSFRDIVAGARHMCAITAAGLVYCWGDNGVRQVDPSTSEPQYVAPHRVGATTAMRISAGTDHTCALDASHNAICWGSNMYLQLGVVNPIATAGTVPGPFDSISAGGSATCTVASGFLACWGHVPGQDTNISGTAPTSIPQQSGVAWTQVAVGDEHAIAATDSQVYGWGDRCAAIGEVGAILPPTSSLPVAGLTVGPFDLAAAIHGGAGGCAMTDTLLKCWGENKASQLEPTNPPACVGAVTMPTSLTGIDTSNHGGHLSLAGSHGCTLRSDKQLACWGDDDELPIGPRADSALPGAVLPQFTTLQWQQIAVGPAASCGIADDATIIRCWGTSVHGEVGNGVRFRDRPSQVLFTP